MPDEVDRARVDLPEQERGGQRHDHESGFQAAQGSQSLDPAVAHRPIQQRPDAANKEVEATKGREQGDEKDEDGVRDTRHGHIPN